MVTRRLPCRHRARHLGLARGVSGGGAEQRRRTPCAKSRVPVSPPRQARVSRAQPGDLEGAPRASSVCAARRAAAAWPRHRIPRARKPPCGVFRTSPRVARPQAQNPRPAPVWVGAPASVRAELWREVARPRADATSSHRHCWGHMPGAERPPRRPPLPHSLLAPSSRNDTAQRGLCKQRPRKSNEGQRGFAGGLHGPAQGREKNEWLPIKAMSVCKNPRPKTRDKLEENYLKINRA